MPTRLVAREPREKFEDPEGLRVLLDRLHAAGRGSWRADPEAAALMRHAAEKYAALARKHGLDPWEAAAAAFDAMRTPSVRRAEDPWAMVTRAVQVTCIAEERANGLLCSVHQARRPRYSVFHDAERFSDRENLLIDYHPAFRVDSVEPDDEDESASSGPEPSTSVVTAVEDAIALGAGRRAGRGRVRRLPLGRVLLARVGVRDAAPRPSRARPAGPARHILDDSSARAARRTGPGARAHHRRTRGVAAPADRRAATRSPAR